MPLPKAWVDQRHRVPDKVGCRVALPPAKADLARRSSSVLVGPVAPVADPAASVVVPVVDLVVRVLAAVAPVRVDVVVVPVVVPRVPLAAVAERVSLASRSGQRGKSMKCGRPRA